jgi:integrase
MTDEIGLMPKTCNKYSICMRRLCNYAAEIGVNRNATSLKVWCERTIHEQDKQKEIYLTDAEIDAMYNMKLKGLFSQVRDAFVIGALTAQRFSDYIRLSSSDITTTERGNRVIVMVQQKTGNKVVIPILDERIVEILQRYEEPLFVIRDTKETQCKAITEQVFNRTIKKVCELLSASIPSLNKEEVTQMTAREKQIEARTGKSLYKRDAHGNVLTPRWRLVTSHTARRSGVTNIYKTGLLDTQEMMSISGHKSERVFEGYIKLSDIEQADKIAGKFKRK